VSNSWPLTVRLFLVLAVLFLAQSARAGAQASQLITPAFSEPVPAETAGDLLFARGQYLEAIDAYGLAPRDATTLNKIGVAWHHLSAVGQAQEKYEEALALRPNFPDALSNLGAVYYTEKKYGRAIGLYRRALKIAPDSPITDVNLGTAYFAEHRNSQGLDAYRMAFLLDPTVFNLDSATLIGGPMNKEQRAEEYYAIAHLLAEMHDTGHAIDFLRKAFGAGFSDTKRLRGDPAFASLHLDPDFASLAGEEDKPK
jgi:tetratricopeptide (TPR) repeat protein